MNKDKKNENEKRIRELQKAVVFDFLQGLAWAGIAFYSLIILLWCLEDIVIK